MENSFTNNVIFIENLPAYEAAATQPINPKYKNVIHLNFLVLFVLFAITVTAFFIIPEIKPAKWMVCIGLSLIFTVSYILQLSSFHRRSYSIREYDLIYKRGILGIETTVVPFNRIQHVAVKEGVFSRMYHLANLQIFTAGGSSADIAIKGLDKNEANRIKEWIVNKIKSDVQQ